jgi:hypothetical protein
MMSNKLMPAVWGGLFLGVLSTLPFVNLGNCLCCMWVVGGGALAAYLLQQNQPAPITLGDGALVGLLAGLVGTIVSAVLAIPMQYVLEPLGLGLQSQWAEAMRDFPEAREVLDRVGTGFIMALSTVFMLFLNMVVATIGGVLGAAVFGRKLPPLPPVAMTPPPPPPSTFEPPSPLA